MLFGDNTAAPVRDLSQDVLLQGKLKSVQVLAAALTGETPALINRGDYVEIQFSPAQKVIMQNWIKKSLTAAPGTVRVDIYGIAMPPLFQVYGKIALVTLLAAFFLGRLSK